MAKRKDILGDVLTSTDQGSFAGLEELSGLLTRTAALVSRPETSRSSTKEKPSTRAIKKKATHYLAPEIFQAIDRMLPQIRRAAPEGAGRRLSKSQLVNASLELLLRDFEEKGKDSWLVRYISERWPN